MLSRSRVVALTLAVTIALAAGAGVVAAQSEEPLEDGQIYWEGTTVVADGFAADGTEAALYTAGGSHVRNITLDGGDLELSTDDLQGEYYVTAPGADRVNFEVIEVQVEVGVSVSRTASGPPYVTAEVTVSSNRDAVMRVTGFDNLAEYAEGDGERVDENTLEVERGAQFTVELDHLAGEQESIRAEDPQTGAARSNIFEIPEITHPPEDGTIVTAERGGEYWAGDTLAFQNATTHEFYRVETVSGEEVVEQQAATDGHLYVNTTGYQAGAYRVLNESDDELTRFGVSVQELDATVDGEALLLESNRDGYNATVSVSNDSTNVTAQVFANINGTTGSLEALGTEEEIALKTGGLAPGEYTVDIRADGGANTSTTFTVAEETPTPTPTETATETATPTPTQTATDAPDDTPSPTETPSDTGTQSPSVTGTSTPGFGMMAALVGVLMGVMAKAHRE